MYIDRGLKMSLKVNEMCRAAGRSYVGKKKQPRWLWWVEDAVTGEIIAFVLGPVRRCGRTHQTFRHLMNLLEVAKIEVIRWIKDSWWAYFDCLDQRFRLIRKASLQSLERKHLTLRTRLKRLTRRTICFSKSVVIHDTIIGLFINQFFFADKRN